MHNKQNMHSMQTMTKKLQIKLPRLLGLFHPYHHVRHAHYGFVHMRAQHCLLSAEPCSLHSGDYFLSASLLFIILIITILNDVIILNTTITVIESIKTFCSFILNNIFNNNHTIININIIIISLTFTDISPTKKIVKIFYEEISVSVVMFWWMSWLLGPGLETTLVLGPGADTILDSSTTFVMDESI